MGLVRRLTWSALVLQMVLVVTGAAVRVTGSGLGCPTWPSCTGGSVANTAALGVHGYIEFGNRLLAVVMEVVGIALVVAVRRHVPQWTRLALVQALVVPIQAVIGGLLVLSGLNPYVLMLHFLTSFALVYAAVALLRRVEGPPGAVDPVVSRLALATLLSSLLVLLAGTLVTGTGPHAGSPKVHRLPFDPRNVTQLHADMVWLLCGLTLALVLLTRGPLQRWTWVLAGLLVAQGTVGYWQYATGVPAPLVAIHVAGATMIFTTAAWIQLSSRKSASTGDAACSTVPHGAREVPGAVDRGRRAAAREG